MNKKILSPIMFVGTGSDVGKSIIVAGFCRIFKQDGYTPAPFKAQNMALNSYATSNGLEIGRAQASQAEAACIPCSTDMNPLLLKPNSNHTSQVILNGKPIGNQSAYSYFREEGREELRQEVHAAFDRLNKKYNPIVLEGAGSVSEINLRNIDLVNMPMAIYAGANVILVADIDRGGVFASVYGSIQLMTEQERKHVKGIIINKFRGDIRLFEQGKKIIEDLCNVPVLGILPYFKDIYIEEEDSVALKNKILNLNSNNNKIKVAVILLNHLSNFTDFSPLEQDSRVHLFYTNNIEDIKKSNIIIVPGSKSTISDLYEIRQNGVAKAIIDAYKNGSTIFGICGGYQIMGSEIYDPEHIEGEIECLPGLGLLPTKTIISSNKITKQITFKSLANNAPQGNTSNSYQLKGYEIHMGITSHINKNEQIEPLNKISDGRLDGCFVNQKCMGTYIHGILDNASFTNYILEPHLGYCNKESFNYQEFKEEQYNKLADLIRQNINMEQVYKIMEAKEND